VIHLQFATRRFVETSAEREPVMLVFEDVHWADDVLLDLIEYLVTHVSDHRILFVALARPEFLEGRPTWGAGMAGTTMLPLDPLTASEASEVIGSLLDSARATTIERVVATAGGNPLFIEELVASLADDPLSEELPGTVRAASPARIDALPPAGRTALLSRERDRTDVLARRAGRHRSTSRTWTRRSRCSRPAASCSAARRARSRTTSSSRSSTC
jgi:hypothetical protein